MHFSQKQKKNFEGIGKCKPEDYGPLLLQTIHPHVLEEDNTQLKDSKRSLKNNIVLIDTLKEYKQLKKYMNVHGDAYKHTGYDLILCPYPVAFT